MAPYLLPTVLYETSSGFDLEHSPATRSTHEELKVDLMDDPMSREKRARAAAYLGLTLRAARQWFLDSQHEVYGRFRLRWALNVGIPSAGYDDERVRTAFLAVARAAWRLSLRPTFPNLKEAAGAFARPATEMKPLTGAFARPATEMESLTTLERAAPSATGLLQGTLFADRQNRPAAAVRERRPPDENAEPEQVDVDVVPEIAAEVVGYARSKHRPEGLHLMVDVGATTIDICGFVLHSADGEDGDQYRLLTALVERLGLHVLHLRRTHVVEAVGGRLCPVFAAAPSPVGAIPDAGRSYVDHLAQNQRDKLDEIDEAYTEECRKAIMTVLMALRRVRDPLSTHWKSGLPVFGGGGGGRFRLVTDALSRSHEWLRNNLVDAQGLKPRSFPALRNLSNLDIPEEMTGRLDVAYGLSFDRLDIGEIFPPHRIQDVPPMPVRPKHDAVGKEQV